MTAKVTWNDAGAHALLDSQAVYEWADLLGFQITAHAVPHSGVDTGRLTTSMSHRVDVTGDDLVITLGSGVADGVEGVEYALPHWANVKDDRPHTKQAEIRKRIPHPTRPAPTKPWSKALAELGIDYTIAPGGHEA